QWGLTLTPPPCGLRGCLQTVAGAPGGLSGTTCGNLIVALGQRRRPVSTHQPPSALFHPPPPWHQKKGLPLNTVQSGSGPAGIVPYKPYISHRWACAWPCPDPFRLATRLQSHGVKDWSGDPVQRDRRRREGDRFK
ncbi:hypothetical protein KUCAC02_025975, partial [Chaenocephalus aceratus]